MSISTDRQKFGKQQRLQAIRYISWLVNLIFLLALAWAIYQAAVNGKPLPAWAWIGMVVLLAAVIGLILISAAILLLWFRQSEAPAGQPSYERTTL